MSLTRTRTIATATAIACAFFLIAGTLWSMPTCPLSYGGTMTARSHKLFIYFPAADDMNFPPSSPAPARRARSTSRTSIRGSAPRRR